MSYEVYQLGEMIQTRCQFSDHKSCLPLDPDQVQLTVKTPAGYVTTYRYPTDPQITRTNAGSYQAQIEAAEAGFYHYRWQATGSVQTAAERRFEVLESMLLN